MHAARMSVMTADEIPVLTRVLEVCCGNLTVMKVLRYSTRRYTIERGIAEHKS